MGRIKNEKLLRLVKEFNRRVTLRHTFQIITLAGKVLSPARVSARGGRFTRPKGPEGAHVDFDFMLEEFYRLRGLDERGFPEAAVLARYGLEEVSRELHGIRSALES